MHKTFWLFPKKDDIQTMANENDYSLNIPISENSLLFVYNTQSWPAVRLRVTNGRKNYSWDAWMRSEYSVYIVQSK